MSRGRKRLTLRVSDTLLTDLTTEAQRRGVDLSAVIRAAVLTHLKSNPEHQGLTVVQPRASPDRDHPDTAPQDMAAAFLHSLDASTRAQLTEAMARFQGSAADLVRAIVRQWGASMKDPRAWRVWRP